MDCWLSENTRSNIDIRIELLFQGAENNIQLLFESDKKNTKAMKTLKTSYFLFTLLCFCPSADSITRWKKIRNIFATTLPLLSLILATISSMMFAQRNLKSDLENALLAIAQSALAIGLIYTIFAAYTLRSKIKKIFIEFQAIYDTCKPSKNCKNRKRYLNFYYSR